MKIFLLTLLVSLSSHAVIITKDLVYTTRGSTPLLLDVYAPEGTATKPAVIYIHGGGWAYGSKDGYHEELLAATREGFVAIAINYRLSDKFPWPAQADDTLAALNFVRRQAISWKIDPARIHLAGESAGAHIALYTGLKDGRVAGILNLYGPTHISQLYDDSPKLQELIVLTFGKDRSLWDKANPTQFLRADSPPILTIHGTLDDVVPFSQAEFLGNYHRLIVREGEGHGLTPESRKEAFAQGLLFFSDKL